MPENCTNDCPMEPRIKALEEANKEHSEIHEKFLDKIGDLKTENAVQNAHYETIKTKLDELAIMVGSFTGKSGKRWESLVDKALWAVCAAVIAFLLGRVGL